MEPKDITNEHTRKEMNSMAEGLGIEDPPSYKNKTKLAEAMIPLMEEELKEEAEKKLNKVKEILKEVRKTSLDINSFKEKFKKLRSEREEGEYESAIETAEELLEEGNKLLTSSDEINELRDLLKQTPECKKKNEFKEELKTLIKEFDGGDYDSFISNLCDITDEVKLYLEKKEDFEEKLTEAKKKLADLRGTKIEINMVKELVHDAVTANKENDFEKGLEHVEEVLECSERIMEVYEKIAEGKEKIQELKGEGLEYKSYVDILKTCKKKADEGDYKYSLQLLNDAITDMNSDLEGDEGEKELEEEERQGEEEKKNEEEDDEEGKEERLGKAIEKENIDKEELKKIYRKIEAIEKALKYIKRDLENMMD